jgi:hypothetical protein
MKKLEVCSLKPETLSAHQHLEDIPMVPDSVAQGQIAKVLANASTSLRASASKQLDLSGTYMLLEFSYR